MHPMNYQDFPGVATWSLSRAPEPLSTPFIPYKALGSILQNPKKKAGTILRDHRTTLNPIKPDKP